VAGPGVAAVEPRLFGFAPVEAADRALAGAGISWSEVTAVELNEAFAVCIACVEAWEVDPANVDVKEGAIAIGPFGASGGRVLGTVAERLRESGESWGAATLCIGVGQSLAVVLENVS
jgi:acetyl-CoA acetyltransferase